MYSISWISLASRILNIHYYSIIIHNNSKSNIQLFLKVLHNKLQPDLLPMLLLFSRILMLLLNMLKFLYMSWLTFNVLITNTCFTVLWKWTGAKITLDSRPCIIITHQSLHPKPCSRRTLLSAHPTTQHCLHLKWTSDQMSLSIPQGHDLSLIPLTAN